MTTSLTAGAKSSGRDGGFINSLFGSHDGIPEWFWKAIGHLDCWLMMPGKEEEILTSRLPAATQAGVRRPWHGGRRAVDQDISLFLIPHIAMRGASTDGEGLERDTVHRTCCHFSTVSIRTRPIKREFKKRPPSRGAPEPHKRGEGGERE